MISKMNQQQTIVAPVTVSVKLEGDVVKYACQEVESHIRMMVRRMRERIEMYDYAEARSIRKYLRAYWSDLLAGGGDPNLTDATYNWAFRLRRLVYNFYLKMFNRYDWNNLRLLMTQVDQQMDKSWQYMDELDADDWLKDLYDEFHPDKVLSKIRIPRQDPRTHES